MTSAIFGLDSHIKSDRMRALETFLEIDASHTNYVPRVNDLVNFDY
jgi:hypothetical protein